MEGNRRSASIGVPVLSIRTALTNLLEPQPLKDCHDFARLEDWWLRHWSGYNGLDADELGLELRFAIL